MIKFKESPAGYLLYSVTIAVNFLVLILRISAHEIHFPTTLAETHSTLNMSITSSTSPMPTPVRKTVEVAAAVSDNTIGSAQYTLESSKLLMCMHQLQHAYYTFEYIQFYLHFLLGMNFQFDFATSFAVYKYVRRFNSKMHNVFPFLRGKFVRFSFQFTHYYNIHM